MKHIEVKDLSFGYTSDLVLRDLNMEVDAGSINVIVGENGSGKSTLLKVLLGQYKPKSGSVKVIGKELSEIKDFRDIGYVPQVQSFHQIAFPITCQELVVLNRYKDFGFFKIPGKKDKKRALEVLNEFGLGAYYKTPFNELSGGLQQRVMIARAMINSPSLVILDEPTAGVDKDSKMTFLKLIEEMNASKKVTIVMVTHEIEVIKNNLHVDRAWRMEEGRLVDVSF